VSDCFWHVGVSLAVGGVTVLSIPSNDGLSNRTQKNFVVVRLTQHWVSHEILLCVCVCVCCGLRLGGKGLSKLLRSRHRQHGCLCKVRREHQDGQHFVSVGKLHIHTRSAADSSVACSSYTEHIAGRQYNRLWKLLKHSEYVCPVLLTKFFSVVSEVPLTKEDNVRNSGLCVAFFAFTRLFFGTAYKVQWNNQSIISWQQPAIQRVMAWEPINMSSCLTDAVSCKIFYY
jgi:hypothetical protein